jgi:cyclic 2,3-diphosphoglycerate synthetase
VRAAIDRLPTVVPGAAVVGAVLLGGGEKLARPDRLEADLGVPVVSGAAVAGADAADAGLAEGLRRFGPELVVDLSDEPVLDARRRLWLAARALAAGVPYRGADFSLAPPPRPRLAAKPSIAVIGTGKRTGKTAVSASVARLLKDRGTPPVVVAMGRGGPPEPEVVDPDAFDLSPAGLVALASSGRHAASDHLEDALVAGVPTVGTRRCGGGLAGAPFDSTFAAGVEIANHRPERMMILEGSGSAIPPAAADATICVVPATADPELVSGYLGRYRMLLSDLIVVSMAERAVPGSGETVPYSSASPVGGSSAAGAVLLEKSVRGSAPGARVVHTVFRPSPLESIAGRRVLFVTTAPASARGLLVGHLEREHGCTIVGTSHHLARRPQLAADLEQAPKADVVLVELKAAAVDLVARFALGRGIGVTFCDNQVVTTGGDGQFEELALSTADLAVARHDP